VRILAVDWSGNASRAGARKAIWTGEGRDGDFELTSGRDREETVDFLVAEAARGPDLVIGLDFAFGLPEWFARSRGAETARDVWRLVAREGEQWLKDPQPPFWRLKKPHFERTEFRRTERDHAAPGIQPKSVFQLGGAGHVGTASLRGMPYLLRLQDTFAIWPFDVPRLPLVVEIYPRLFTAAGWAQGLPDGLNEHARDAAASALAMSAWKGDWDGLALDSRYALEGRIWRPEPPLDSDP
jgi:hypothetical protein